jgi:pimeloyl-ACP methyl ester carboxylesterase
LLLFFKKEVLAFFVLACMENNMDGVRYWLQGEFPRLAYTAWGDPALEPVVCVHGLTRTGRDFDELAQSLSDRFYVVCPDLPGRGGSDWLPRGELYQPQTYVLALSHLLAAIGRPVCWVGTSLGGICGMLAAASAHAPITRLVLNDIGPFVPEAALSRIRDYVGVLPEFTDLEAAATYLRRVHAPFGNLSDAQWLHLARTGTRALPDGRFTLHYDPAIAAPMRAGPVQAIDLWPFWDRIVMPTLALRGADSDLLLPETVMRMSKKAATHTVPDCGHAPALMDAATIAVVRKFLEAR